MNTENSTESLPQIVGEPLPKVEGAPPKSGGGIVWLVFLLSLMATGLGAFCYFQLTALQSDTTLADQIRQRDAHMQQLQQRIESLGALVGEMNTSMMNLEQLQQTDAESLRRLAGSIAADNTDLAVAEIEQLLIMAIHNLTLQRDVNVALAAMEAADQRLAGLDIVELRPTREQLAADMNALKSVNAVDITGLSLYLVDLSNRVSRLPLNSMPDGDATAVAADTVVDVATPAWQRLLTAVWQEFKGMFVVTRNGSGAQATLLPDESWFLYQNLRLQIETARLAVIRRDTETMRSALQQVSSWLQDYFDTSDGDVANILQTTGKMAALDLAPELPDISSSLETLRAFIRSRATTDTTVGQDAP